MRKAPIILASLLLGTSAVAGTTKVVDVDRSDSVTVRHDREKLIEGSGHLVRQSRTLNGFTAVEADDAVNVVVTIGRTYALTIEADDNLIGRVTTEVRNGTLRVGAKGSYRTAHAPLVRITMPDLRALALQSSSNGSIHGLHGASLALSSNGSGNFTADGRVGSLRLALEGSGSAELGRLAADDVDAVVNGSGNARLRAERRLNAVANGSGTILYAGRAQARVSANGSATVRKSGD